VDDDAIARHLRQHDKVVHVPVQDAGRVQQPHLIQLEPHRPRRETKALGHADEVLEVCALQRD
jgi:hypothetical protein